jgi:hypothetical protein
MKLDRVSLGFTLDGKAISKAQLEGPVDSMKVHLHVENGHTYVYTLAGVLALARNLLSIGKVAESLGAKASDMSVSDINDALLNGTLGIGSNGLPVSPAFDRTLAGWCKTHNAGSLLPVPECRECGGCGGLAGPEAAEMRDGKKIAAIKLYRERTNEGLKDSKDTVESWAYAAGIAERRRRY